MTFPQLAILTLFSGLLLAFDTLLDAPVVTGSEKVFGGWLRGD